MGKQGISCLEDLPKNTQKNAHYSATIELSKKAIEYKYDEKTLQELNQNINELNVSLIGNRIINIRII